MKTITAILILLAFFQATFLPLNLVLITLIARSFIKNDVANYYLAFGVGVLISVLNLSPVGWDSLLYLVAVVLVQLFGRSRFTNNSLLIVPIALVITTGCRLGLYLILGISPVIWPYVLIEAAMALPVLLLLRLWEERFIVRRDIKLKL